MKKILAHGNYFFLALILVGLSLWLSFGLAAFKGRAGLGSLLLGISGLIAYFALNIAKFKNRNSRLNFIFASNLAVLLLLIVSIVVAVNYLGMKIHRRFDFTEAQSNSISAQSVQVLKTLNQSLKITAFFSKSHAGLPPFNSLLPVYQFHSDQIKVAVIDPFLKPELVKQYDVKNDGTMIFEYNGRSSRSEEVSEEAITNAIIKVSRQREKTVYFTQMHGEPDIDSTQESGYAEAKNNLEKLSFKVKKLLLFQEASVPADAAALVIAGPQKPLFAKEIFLLENYIQKKRGRVLLLLDPFTGAELKPLLKKFGLILEDNVVVENDPVSRLMGGNYFMPVVAEYKEHPITRNFAYATMFPMVRGLEQVTPAPAGVRLDFIAATSANSWGETQYASEIKTGTMSKNPEDKKGPLAVAAAVEVNAAAAGSSRLVVCGDADFAQNKYFYFQANGNLFSNMVSWLAEEDDLIAVAPKLNAPRTIRMNQSGGRLVFFYTLLILPLLVFVTGIGIWLYRRKL